MLVHGLRRWFNIEPKLHPCLVFGGVFREGDPQIQAILNHLHMQNFNQIWGLFFLEMYSDVKEKFEKYIHIHVAKLFISHKDTLTSA